MRPVVLLTLLALTILGYSQRQVPRQASARDSQLAVKVKVDGEQIQFADTSPVMQGSRILVPLRGVFEHMGAQLSWDPKARTVTAFRNGQKIVLPIGASQAQIDERAVALDQPAMVIDNRTFVPLRFLAEALNAKVDWLTAERTVEIRTESRS